MACIAAEWVDRGRSHYRSCYDERGRACCRVDLAEAEPGGWQVRLRRGKTVSVSVGLSEGGVSEAKSLATAVLKGCGCAGGDLGRRRRR